VDRAGCQGIKVTGLRDWTMDVAHNAHVAAAPSMRLMKPGRCRSTYDRFPAPTRKSPSPRRVEQQPGQLFGQPHGFFTITVPNYDVSLDGQRFLMAKDESGSQRLNLALKWTEELKRLVPTKYR